MRLCLSRERKEGNAGSASLPDGIVAMDNSLSENNDLVCLVRDRYFSVMYESTLYSFHYTWTRAHQLLEPHNQLSNRPIKCSGDDVLED